MNFTPGILAVLSAVTLSACSNQPCDEAALNKYSKILTQKMPLLVELEIEQKAAVFAKLAELNKMKNVPKDELCVLVKELLDEVDAALE